MSVASQQVQYEGTVVPVGNSRGDPVMVSFLQFLERQMTDSPQDVIAADADQLHRIGKLVKGVKIG